MKNKYLIITGTSSLVLFLLIGIVIQRSFSPPAKAMKDYDETQLFGLAQQTANRQGPLAALPYFDELLKRDPRHFPAYEHKADCLLQLKRYPEALQALETAAMASPSPEKYQSKIEFIKNKITTDGKIQ